MFFNKKKKLLKVLLEKFSSLITDEDKNNCRELLANREYLLCYTTLVTQIYEYDKEITKEEYEFFKNTAEKLGFETSEYILLKELVREKNW